VRSSRDSIRPLFYPVAAWVVAGSLFLTVNWPGQASASPRFSPASTSALAAAPTTAPPTSTVPTTAVPTTTPPVTTTTVAPHVASSLSPTTLAPAPIKPASPAPAPGQEAWVSIPAIGLNLPVFAGGQSVIDEGVVTHFSAPGWRPPVAAGQPGTYWLAAHHVTHGAPFLNLPSVHPGDLVVITPVNGGAPVRYVITSMQVVGTSVPYTTVYGPDTTTPRLLLQTCEGGAYRLLVHGVLA
jgi:hypothetical protein